jgi:uncharacterized membrane protein YqjE
MTNTEADHQLPTLGRLARRTLATFVGAVENRAQLFTVEFQEENGRLIRTIILGLAAVFLGMMGLLLVTATIIFLLPEQYRLYAAIGFAVLYLGGATAAALTAKKLVTQAPFPESLNQLKKDSELLQAFK